MSFEAPATRMAEFARGWTKLLTALVGVTLGSTAIFFYTQGQFIKPLQAEFGWSRGQASMMPTIFGLTLAVASPLCGMVVDRFGVRAVSAVSILFLAGGFWALSLMTGSLLQFALIVLVIAVLGSGTCAVPYVRLVGGWFDRARGLAIGLIMMGSGVTALVAPRLVGHSLQAHGWRSTYEALAVAALFALPLVLLFGAQAAPRRPVEAPAAPVAGMTFRAAAGSLRFWVLGLTFALAGTAVAGLMPHFVPLLQDSGMTPVQAGAAMSVVGFAIIAGRFITGFACDHVFAPFVATGVLVLAALGCVGLALIGPAFATPAALLIGLAMGAEIDLAGYMSARYFGLKAYGAIFGFQYGLFSVGAGLGPLVNGLLYDHFGGYRIALLTAATLLLASIPAVLSLGRYPEAQA